MPSFGSGEMLGTLKVPNGEGIGKPPPSFKRSGWFGTAWQEEHPPALNVVRPLARLGVCGGSAFDAMTAGIVSHQKIPKPATPAKTTRRRSRRSIQQPVVCSVFQRTRPGLDSGRVPVRMKKTRQNKKRRFNLPAQYDRSFSPKLASNF